MSANTTFHNAFKSNQKCILMLLTGDLELYVVATFDEVQHFLVYGLRNGEPIHSHYLIS